MSKKRSKRVRFRRVVPWTLSGLEQGRADGQRTGWQDGYRLGRAQAFREKYASIPVPGRYPVKVMYVTTGISVPYTALDQAILEGLREAAEHVLVVSPDDDLGAAAAQERPDLVLLLHGYMFQPERLQPLREAGIRTAIWFSDDPYYTDWSGQIAPLFDYVFTLELNCVEFYRSRGCAQVYHLPMAASLSQFYPRRVAPDYKKDACFIGSAFQNRVQVIDTIAPYLSGIDTMISGWWWERLSTQLLAGKVRTDTWLSPEETAAYYNGAKVVLNLHRAATDGEHNENSKHISALSVNPRTFEICACAAMQLTDARSDLASLYVPGVEIVTYESPDDLVHKLDYYLHHEEERREIALRGYARTVREHTYGKRLHQLLGHIFG